MSPVARLVPPLRCAASLHWKGLLVEPLLILICWYSEFEKWQKKRRSISGINHSVLSATIYRGCWPLTILWVKSNPMQCNSINNEKTVKISGSNGTKSGSCGASMGADRARQRIAEQSQGTDGCHISQRKLKHPLPQVFRDARWDDGPVETIQTSLRTSVSDQTTKVCHRETEKMPFLRLYTI